MASDPALVALFELARTAAAGDAAATSRLVRELAPRIVRVVCAIVGPSHPEVEDISQQALVGFVHAVPAFRGESSPQHYATKIAVRTAIAARKRARQERSRLDQEIDPDAVVGRHPDPGEDAAAWRRRELLRGLLSELATEQAEALAMRIVLGWSIEEIAGQCNAPPNTIRSRLRLAKEALKRMIERRPGLYEELEVEV